MTCLKYITVVLFLTSINTPLFSQEEGHFSINREEMVLKLSDTIKDERITMAFLAVPRHLYVPADYLEMAYELVPIPLDDQKILPAPDILAMIFDKAGLSQESRILLIGASCNYSAAILSRLVAMVFVIDRYYRVVEPRDNILIKRSTGWDEWKGEAPFDFIFVQDAVGAIPSSLFTQLRPGGILVFPLLTESGYQTLIMIKKGETDMEIRSLGDGFFTPIYQ